MTAVKGDGRCLFARRLNLDGGLGVAKRLRRLVLGLLLAGTGGALVACKKPIATQAPVEPKASISASPEAARTTTAASPWNVVKVGEFEYVTAESLQKFYRFPTARREGRSLYLESSHIVMQAEVGSQNIWINRIKVVLDRPVVEEGGQVLFSRSDLGYFIDPLLRPSKIAAVERFDTVVIDPGGEADLDAHDDLTLKLAQNLRAELKGRGYSVVMTREMGGVLTNDERVKIANEMPKSIFLSVQLKRVDEATKPGVETFALTAQKNPAGAALDTSNIALAMAVHARVVSQGRRVDLGVKRAGPHVLEGCQRPGIVFKGSFAPDAQDNVELASEANVARVSAAISAAVIQFGKAVNAVASK